MPGSAGSSGRGHGARTTRTAPPSAVTSRAPTPAGETGYSGDAVRITVTGTAGAANQDYPRGLGALATTYGEGWVERVRRLGHVDAALDLAGSGVIHELVDPTGNPQKVVSVADLGAPEPGVRFSGVAGSVREALAVAAGLVSRGRLHIPVEKTYTLAEAAAAHVGSRAGTRAGAGSSSSEGRMGGSARSTPATSLGRPGPRDRAVSRTGSGRCPHVVPHRRLRHALVRRWLLPLRRHPEHDRPAKVARSETS